MTDLHSAIRDVLAGVHEDIGTGAELAAKLARKADDCESRLIAALKHLEEGHYVLALIAAGMAPPISELLSEIDFPEADAWREHCITRGWPVAPVIDRDAVARLYQLESDATNKSNVIKWYRSAARERNLRVCVWLLRKLVRLEPSNESFKADLRSYEHRFIENLHKEFAGAHGRGDHDAVAGISRELQSGDWLIKLPPDFMLSVSQAAREADRQAAIQEVSGLIEHLGAAYSSMNINEGIRLVGQIDALISTHRLELPPNLSTQYGEGRSWCRKEEKLRDEQQMFDCKLDELVLALEKSDAVRTDELLNELARFDRALPELVSDRAHQLVENWALTRERARKRVAVTVVLALLALIIGGSIIWRNHQSGKRADVIAGELQTHIDNLDKSSYERVVARLRAQEPGLLRHPVVIPFLDKDVDIDRRLEEQREAFDAALAGIRLAMEDEALLQEVDALIAEIEETAINAEQLGTINQVTLYWVQQKSRLRSEYLDDLESYTLKADEILASLEAGETDLDQPTIQERLNEAKALLSSFPAPPFFESGNPAEPYLVRLAAIQNRADEVAKQLEAIATAPNLNAYLDALDLFVRAFPDDQRSASMSRVSSKARYYRALMESPSAASGGNIFWSGMRARKQLAEPVNEAEWQRVQAMIIDWEQDERLVNVRQYRYTENSLVTKNLFIQGEPEPANDSFNYRVLIYEAVDGSRQKKPAFKMSNFGRSRWPHAQRMTYCVIVDQLVAAIKTADAGSGHSVLLDQTLKLFKHRDLDDLPLFKAYLGHQLLGLLKEISPASDVGVIEELETQFRPEFYDIHWLCVGHPQYRSLSRQAGMAVSSIVAGLEGIAGARDMITVDREIEARRPFLYAINEGHGIPRRKISTDASEEYWLLRVVDQQVRIVICARLSQDGEMVTIIKPDPGEPVFAPGDRRLSTRLLADLRDRGIHLSSAAIKSDPAWPANMID